jgi:hypothetical protein
LTHGNGDNESAHSDSYDLKYIDESIRSGEGPFETPTGTFHENCIDMEYFIDMGDGDGAVEMIVGLQEGKIDGLLEGFPVG